MRITKVSSDGILFDTGDNITCDHEQNCCEHNDADFMQLDDIARNTEFKKPLTFEFVDGSGFRFGNKNKMFFVPCYSEQNGYYSSAIDILFNDRIVSQGYCEIS